MKKIISLVMLAVALNGFSAVIQEETMELGLQGQLTFDNYKGKTDFSIYPSLGYFIMDNIQVGGLMGVIYDGHDMGFRLGGFGEINFDTYTAFMPYLAVRLMYDFGSLYKDNYLLIDGAAGMKFFVSPTLAIAAELYYDLASEDVFADNHDGARNHNAGMRLGLRHYF
ncbi:MAG: hypothetical protein ABR497_01400 [Kiritimatiellia bacterium]|nr:hypothetical protein [Lentisphaerota bacterium]